MIYRWKCKENSKFNEVLLFCVHNVLINTMYSLELVEKVVELDKSFNLQYCTYFYPNRHQSYEWSNIWHGIFIMRTLCKQITFRFGNMKYTASQGCSPTCRSNIKTRKGEEIKGSAKMTKICSSWVIMSS